MTIPTLAELTTFRVGGPIRDYLATDDRAALIDAIKKADEAGTPLLVIGGGSNLLACDEGFEGLVVKDLRSEIHIEQTPASTRAQAEPHDPEGPCRATRRVTASAGTIWDEFVDWSLDEGLSGLEALSGIPGTVGAAPVQNIGAYGHELGETLLEVRVWDRHKKQETTLGAEELAFGYRESIIKRSIHTGDENGKLWGPSGRWIVLEATFLLEVSPLSSPVLYRELANRLGIEQGVDRQGHGLGASPHEGHGPRPRGSRLVERGLILHEPDPLLAGRRTPPRRGTPLPNRRRARQNFCRVAYRPCGLPEGVFDSWGSRGRGRAVWQARARPDESGAGERSRSCGAGA